LPRDVFNINAENFVTRGFWSDEWYSLTPWKHDTKTMPYFSRIVEQRENVLLTFLYIGPVGIIHGKWTGS
jgi:hypothetical protein